MYVVLDVLRGLRILLIEQKLKSWSVWKGSVGGKAYFNPIDS